MTIENLGELMLSALGKGNEDEAIWEAFAAVSLFNWPSDKDEAAVSDEDEWDEEDEDDDDEDWDDDDEKDAHLVEYWRYGCSLNFTEADEYAARHGEQGAQGDLVVFAINFYLRGIEGFRPFSGVVPFDLAAGMKPDEVAQCLGVCQASRIICERRVDLFFVDNYVLNVFYSSEDEGLEQVEIANKTRYDRDDLPQDFDIDWRVFADALGRKCKAPETLNMLSQGLGLPVQASDLEEAACHAYCRSHGVILYTRPGKELERFGASAQNREQRFLVRVEFRRAGYFNCAGYRGALPFGLTFSDPPEKILEKLPAEPDTATISDFVGHYGIEHEGRYYHIQYSRIFWQMLSIHISIRRNVFE